MDLLDKMATYVRVIETGSFSAAAKQLRISAAAVSRQIATLEAEVKVQLLVRSTRRMTITPAGHRYHERCLRILRDVDEAQAIGQGGGVEGLLKVSAPVTFGLATIAPHLSTLVERHPGLRIDFRLEDRLVDLVFEGVDVAIRVGSLPLDSTEIVAHRLFAFHRVLVASPGYLKRRGVPRVPESLASHDALSHAIDGSGERWSLVSAARPVRVRTHVVFSSNAGHVLRDAAERGAGIALLPSWFVADAVAAKKLRIVLPGWTSEPVVVSALHRTAHRGEQRVRALVEHLKRAYEADPKLSR